MPATRLDLPSNYTATHVVGVTRGDNKIRPTVYFATGSHFTQSHKSRDNIGYHAPPGKHLFFGNVSASLLDELEDFIATEGGHTHARTFMPVYHRSLVSAFSDGTGKPCQVNPPDLGQDQSGQVLLEVLPHGWHRSRAALEPVSYSDAAQLVREIRSRTTEKLGPHSATEEYYFAQNPDG